MHTALTRWPATSPSSDAADRWVATTCGYCSVGCGMLVGVKEGRAVAVRGNPDHPVNHGLLCPKGLSEHHTLDASNRARHPLLRRQGKLGRVTLGRGALDDGREVSRGAGALRCRVPSALSAPDSSSPKSSTHSASSCSLGWVRANYDGNTTLCMSTAVAGYKRSFGSDGPPGAYEDLDRADVILLIGANIADNHPILCRRVEANRRATVVVVDPRVTKTAMMADLHLPIRPRSDLALLNGLIRVIIEQDLVDRRYIERHTTGFDALRESVADYTLERVAEITGLTPELICRTAWLYARARAAFIGWTMGVNHSTKGTETVNAINNLALITGNIGRAGASPFSITGQCNAMGTREAGFASSLPGYRKFEDADGSRGAGLALWQIPVERIPTARGLAYPDIIEAALDGRIRALWIIATNPVVSFPNLGVLQQALENLEFLVVQDGFHPTPTTEMAHLVLPAAIWGEKEGTYTNSERRVSKVNRVVDPPGEARPDFDIFLSLAETLGVRDELFPGWRTPEDAFNEWKRVSAGRLCDYSGMTYEAIESHGGLQWPMPEGTSDVDEPRRLYADGRFETADGRARLIPVEWEPFPEPPNPDFPLVLNTGRTVEHWHTRTKTGKVPILERLSPEAWVEMNPRDARRAPTEASGPRGRRVTPGPCARHDTAGDRDRRARTDFRAVSLRGGQRQSGHAERVRSDLARAQLQAVGGPRREDLSRTRRDIAMKRLVVVGNGMAGARVVEEILKRAPDRFEIVMFGAEPYGNYNRILLSNVLNGSQAAPDIFMNPLSWYRENGITLHAGVKATRIDRERRVVVGAPLPKNALAYAADAVGDEGAALRRGALRPRHHRHRLSAVRPADGWVRRSGHLSLPHDRRLRPHRGLRQGLPACGRHRRRSSGTRSGARAADARGGSHRPRSGSAVDDGPTRLRVRRHAPRNHRRDGDEGPHEHDHHPNRALGRPRHPAGVQGRVEARTPTWSS